MLLPASYCLRCQATAHWMHMMIHQAALMRYDLIKIMSILRIPLPLFLPFSVEPRKITAEVFFEPRKTVSWLLLSVSAAEGPCDPEFLHWRLFVTEIVGDMPFAIAVGEYFGKIADVEMNRPAAVCPGIKESASRYCLHKSVYFKYGIALEG